MDLCNWDFKEAESNRPHAFCRTFKSHWDMLSGAFAFEDEIVHIELSFVLNNPDSFNSESVKVHYCFSAVMLDRGNHSGSTTANQQTH